MTDLLLGLSQLATHSSYATEQRALPVSPAAVRLTVRETAIANTPQPQVITQSPEPPKFSADSTPTLNFAPKLQQLRETVPLPANSASLDELLVTAMDSEIAIADLQQGLKGAPDTQFDFTSALSNDVPDMAIEDPTATFEFDLRHWHPH